MKIKGFAVCGPFVVTAAVAAFAIAPSAMAATNNVWTGGDTTSDTSGATPAPSGNWSLADNWDMVAGAPTPPTEANLTFHDLGSGCDTAPASAACYVGTDDLGATLPVGTLSIDDGAGYNLFAAQPSDTLTIEGDAGTPNVGLNASDISMDYAFPEINIPIVLGASSQQWNIADGTLDIGQVTSDPADALTINLGTSSIDPGYLETGELDTGPITVEGSGHVQLDNDPSYAQNPFLSPGGVTLQNNASLIVATTGATSGPIDASSTTGRLEVISGAALPQATLNVNGGSGNVTLGSTSALEFDINGDGATDASELTAAGTVTLGGAALDLFQEDDGVGQPCVALTPGVAHTLVSAPAGISGTLTVGSSQISQGQTAAENITTSECTDPNFPEASVLVTYGATTITATVQTAPVNNAAPTIGVTSPTTGGTPVVGGTVALTYNGSWSAWPPINANTGYAYQWQNYSNSAWSNISGANGTTYTPTNADVGDDLRLKVTATNSVGSTSAYSSASAAVVVPTPPPTTTTPTDTTPTSTTPTTPTNTPTTPTTPTTPGPTPPSAAKVRTALNAIAHPAGLKAINALLKTKSFKTTFHAPSAGEISIVWTTVVTVGTGKHKKRTTVTLATVTAHTSHSGTLTEMVHLTTAGKALLKKKPNGVSTKATNKFQPTGGKWTSTTKTFSL